MIGLPHLPICYRSITHAESLGATKIPLKNWAWKSGRIINNSTAHCPIVFKSDMLLGYGPRRPQSCKKTTSGQTKMSERIQIRHIYI